VDEHAATMNTGKMAPHLQIAGMMIFLRRRSKDRIRRKKTAPDKPIARRRFRYELVKDLVTQSNHGYSS
jgi:hypothetical protein